MKAYYNINICVSESLICSSKLIGSREFKYKTLLRRVFKKETEKQCITTARIHIEYIRKQKIESLNLRTGSIGTLLNL